MERSHGVFYHCMKARYREFLVFFFSYEEVDHTRDFSAETFSPARHGITTKVTIDSSARGRSQPLSNWLRWSISCLIHTWADIVILVIKLVPPQVDLLRYSGSLNYDTGLPLLRFNKLVASIGPKSTSSKDIEPNIFLIIVPWFSSLIFLLVAALLCRGCPHLLHAPRRYRQKSL